VPKGFEPSKELVSVLADVGVPEEVPFVPDPFQLQAVKAIERSDVLVCAPTGAGKTWIAEQAMARRLSLGQRSWYASPLKALSNAKYEEFRGKFGPENVGILTGDRKENPDAPIIVGTTEILRNQLYDAMERDLHIPVELVVLDEAHYLSDPERGVVWEEVLIYLPSRVRILLLSATIGNPKEICLWLEKIRGERCQLVSSKTRPVPLYPVFVGLDGKVGLLLGKKGLGREARKYLQERLSSDGRAKTLRLEDIVEGLRQLGMLPAIFFLKSRADCDRAVESFQGIPRPVSAQEETWEALEPLLREFPVLKGHRHIKAIIRHRIAAHHAGHLPQWKLVVERLMSGGHLDAIFSTSTVAAGVDFPARTVVLLQSDKFNGREFLPLTATELQQMTGRAGRRGKDKVGFALFVPGRHQEIDEVARLLKAKPEPLRSQIQINFSMVLNLLLSHGLPEIKGLLSRSLAAMQGEDSGDDRIGSAKWKHMRAVLGWRPQSVLLGKALPRGSVFLHKNGAHFVAIRGSERRGRVLLMCHKWGKRPKLRKGSLVLRGIHPEDVVEVLPYRVPIPQGEEDQLIAQILEMEYAKWEGHGSRGGLGPEGLGGPLGARKRPAKERNLGEETDDLELGLWDEDSSPEARLWISFLEHLRFLRETGFVNEANKLTSEGRWASRLRLDHPLLVAEAIRKGALQGRSAPVLAGLMASFVMDKDKEVYVRRDDLEEMASAFDEMVMSIWGMGRLLAERGFPTPNLQFWPAAALYIWAKGVSWNELTKAIALDEGDLVYLIVRTADHLRQLCDLWETHAGLATSARLALRRIQREPAIYW